MRIMTALYAGAWACTLYWCFADGLGAPGKWYAYLAAFLLIGAMAVFDRMWP